MAEPSKQDRRECLTVSLFVLPLSSVSASSNAPHHGGELGFQRIIDVPSLDPAKLTESVCSHLHQQKRSDRIMSSVALFDPPVYPNEQSGDFCTLLRQDRQSRPQITKLLQIWQGNRIGSFWVVHSL